MGDSLDIPEVHAMESEITLQRQIVSNYAARLNTAEDLAHWTHRMLQALDIYWLCYEGLPRSKWDTVRSQSTGEDWWHRFEKYRARVESLVKEMR